MVQKLFAAYLAVAIGIIQIQAKSEFNAPVYSCLCNRDVELRARKDLPGEQQLRNVGACAQRFAGVAHVEATEHVRRVLELVGSELLQSEAVEAKCHVRADADFSAEASEQRPEDGEDLRVGKLRRER